MATGKKYSATKLTQREIDLLSNLLKNGATASLSNLAQTMTLTENQLRYAITKINRFLTEQGLRWVTLTHDQIAVPQPEETQTALNYFVSHTTPDKFRYSEVQKRRFILLKLLLADQPIPTSYFMEALYSSRTTIVKTLEAIRSDCQLMGLELQHVRRAGYLIKRSGFQKILHFYRLLTQTINLREIYSFYYQANVYSKMGELVLFNVFNLDNLVVALEKTSRYAPKDKPLDDSDFFLLAILNYKIIILNELGHTADQQQLLAIAELAEQLFTNTQNEDLTMETDLVAKMNQAVHETFPGRFTLSEEFSRSLVHHLRHVFFRHENGLLLPESAVGTQSEPTQRLQATITKILQQTDDRRFRQISTGEIELIAAYYLSEVEKINHQERPQPRFLVVCLEGQMMAQVLRNKLLALTPRQNIDFAAVYQVNAIQANAYDLVISTMKLPSIDQQKLAYLDNGLSENVVSEIAQRLAILPQAKPKLADTQRQHAIKNILAEADLPTAVGQDLQRRIDQLFEEPAVDSVG